jgi:hypothetical protein
MRTLLAFMLAIAGLPFCLADLLTDDDGDE